MAKTSKKPVSEAEKRAKHRVTNKLSMRRVRQKMTEEDLEERRRKDRERYQKKKEKGLVKNISDVTPRQKRVIRKNWKEASKRYRQKKKNEKQLTLQTEQLISETPPHSPSPSVSSRSSRALSGQRRAMSNRRLLKQENLALKLKLKQMEVKVMRYKTRLQRSQHKIASLVSTPTGTKFNSIAAMKKKAVEKFLEQDECSKMTAGKKETVTKKGVKKQIRFLLDNIYILYKKFLLETKIKMSYALFCKYRPFWVLIPNVNKRDTCLCIIHSNMEHVVKSLKLAKIIDNSTTISVIKSLCCDGKLQEACLTKVCRKCKDSKIDFKNHNPNDTITYDRWVTKKVDCIVKGQTKTVTKTVKDKVVTTKQKLCQILIQTLPKFMNHINNIGHQYQAVNFIKNQVTDDWALLHLDFSENYTCKYGEEVQSAHFGGSKPQITLHTSVLYHYDSESKHISIQSFCTLSGNIRHDPVLICAHLLPILDEIKSNIPNLKTMHFTSDGPVTQYRNKKMFYLIANYLATKLDVDCIMWHYSEAGHGKGAPDGIGGCVKRVADQAVALGNDVSNFESFADCIQERCPGIKIISICDSEIDAIEELLKQNNAKAFKGTLNIHQVVWHKNTPTIMYANRLSCFSCPPTKNCDHYGLGVVNVEKIISAGPSPTAKSSSASSPILPSLSRPPLLSPQPSSNPSLEFSLQRSLQSSPQPSRQPTPPSPISLPRSPTSASITNGPHDESPSMCEVNKSSGRKSFYRWCYNSSSSSSNVSTPEKPSTSYLPKPLIPAKRKHALIDNDSSSEEIF